jgi:hypothetical protein
VPRNRVKKVEWFDFASIWKAIQDEANYSQKGDRLSKYKENLINLYNRRQKRNLFVLKVSG